MSHGLGGIKLLALQVHAAEGAATRLATSDLRVHGADVNRSRRDLVAIDGGRALRRGLGNWAVFHLAT